MGVIEYFVSLRSFKRRLEIEEYLWSLATAAETNHHTMRNTCI